MVEVGKVEVDATQKGVAGAVRMRKIAEEAKKRFRPIGWTRDVNEAIPEFVGVNFRSAYERRQAALKGFFGITLDFAGWYDQFKYKGAVKRFFCFSHNGKRYRLRSLSMGQRHAVAIGHLTTLRLLDFPMDCDYEAYIDNVRFVGSREEVLRAAEVFIVRCRAARAKINEDVEGLAAEVAESLLRQEGEWLGEQVDYKSKTVKCSERTLLKVVVETPGVDVEAVCRPLLTPTVRVGNAGYGTGPAFRRAEISSDGGVELGFEPSGMPGGGGPDGSDRGSTGLGRPGPEEFGTHDSSGPADGVGCGDGRVGLRVGCTGGACPVGVGEVSSSRMGEGVREAFPLHGSRAGGGLQSPVLHREPKRGHAGEDFLRLDDGGAGTTERIQSGILREHGGKPPAQGFPVVATRGGTCAW
jgi:hypothetical protein